MTNVQDRFAHQFYKFSMQMKSIPVIKLLFIFSLLGFTVYSFSKEVYINEFGLSVNIPDDWVRMPQEWINWYNEQSLNQNNFIAGFCHEDCTSAIDEPSIILDYMAISDLASYNSMKDLLILLANKFYFEDPFEMEIKLKGENVVAEEIQLSQPYCDPKRAIIYGLFEGSSDEMDFIGCIAARPIKTGILRFNAVFSTENFDNYASQILTIYSTIQVKEEFDLDFSKLAFFPFLAL